MQVIQLRLQNSLQNFNYIVFSKESKECFLIDPLDETLVMKEISKENLKPIYITNTHEHYDHTGANGFFSKKFSIPVYAHESLANKIPYFTQAVKDGDLLFVGGNKIKVLFTPGHTLGHICLFAEVEKPLLFCGDTLFHGGVGNCYNGGDPNQLYETFEKIIFKLPRNTLLYPGHYYLEKNLRFGLSILPNDRYFKTAYEKFRQTRDDKRTLQDEFESNLFFRLDDPLLREALWERGLLSSRQATNKEVFLILRKLRDKF